MNKLCKLIYKITKIMAIFPVLMFNFSKDKKAVTIFSILTDE
jgi:hypothetical protein